MKKNQSSTHQLLTNRWKKKRTLDITNLSGIELWWMKNAEMKQMLMFIVRKLGRLLGIIHKLSFQLKQANGVCLSDKLTLLIWIRISNEECRRRTETHICHLDSNKLITSQACLTATEDNVVFSSC